MAAENKSGEEREDELLNDLLYNYVQAFHQVFPYYEVKKPREEIIKILKDCLHTKKPYRGH